MKYSMLSNNGFIIAISAENVLPDAISENEYNAIKALLSNVPVAKEGFVMMLTVNLTWDEVQKSEPEEATVEDYESALERFGAR